jgi:hypothetical protein
MKPDGFTASGGENRKGGQMDGVASIEKGTTE